MRIQMVVAGLLLSLSAFGELHTQGLVGVEVGQRVRIRTTRWILRWSEG